LVTVYFDGSSLDNNSGFAVPEKSKLRLDRIKIGFFILFFNNR